LTLFERGVSSRREVVSMAFGYGSARSMKAIFNIEMTLASIEVETYY
jgi:hypothetical protein